MKSILSVNEGKATILLSVNPVELRLIEASLKVLFMKAIKDPASRSMAGAETGILLTGVMIDDLIKLRGQIPQEATEGEALSQDLKDYVTKGLEAKKEEMRQEEESKGDE